MSTINDEITRIKEAKDNLKASIESKGVAVGEDKIDKYYLYVNSIEQGGDVTVTNLNVSANGTYTAGEGEAYSPVVVNVPTSANLTTLNATQNQTYVPDPQYDGYSSVTVNVQPNLTTLSVTSNNTYRPGAGYDGFSEVTVNVPQSAASLTTLTATTNQTYRPGAGYDGYSEVTVAVPQTAANLTTLNATQNTTYTPSAPYDGYDSVTVNVQPNLTTLTATSNNTYTPSSPYQGFSSVTVNVPQTQENYIKAYVMLGYDIMFGTEYNYNRQNNTDYFINPQQTGITAVYIDGVLQNPIPSLYCPTDHRIHEVKVVFTAATSLVSDYLFGVSVSVIGIDFTHFTGRTIGNFRIDSYTPLITIPDNVANVPLTSYGGIDYYIANPDTELGNNVNWNLYGKTFLNANNTADTDIEGNVVWNKTNEIVKVRGDNYIIPEGVTNLDINLSGANYITLPSTLETFNGFGYASTNYYFTGDPANLTISAGASDMNSGYVLVPAEYEMEYIDLFERVGLTYASTAVTPVSTTEMEIVWNGTDKYIKIRNHNDYLDNINRIHRITLTNPNGAGGQPEVISVFPLRREDSLYIPSFLFPSAGTYTLTFEFYNPTSNSSTERMMHVFDGGDDSDQATGITAITIDSLQGRMGNWFIANYPDLKFVYIMNDIDIISDSFCYNCDTLDSIYIYSGTVPTLEGYDHFGLGEGHTRSSAITVYVSDPEAYRQDASWADLEARDVIKFETM